jgi:hypothetical protein
MKTTNSPNGLFGKNFFFAAIVIAVASLTGCSAAVGEASEATSAELDDKATEPHAESLAIDTASEIEHLEGQPSATQGGAAPQEPPPPARIHRIQ